MKTCCINPMPTSFNLQQVLAQSPVKTRHSHRVLYNSNKGKGGENIFWMIFWMIFIQRY